VVSVVAGGGAGEAQAAAPAGGAKAAKAPGAPAVAAQAKKGEDGRAVFYPGANPMVTRTVRHVHHAMAYHDSITN
jgi:hypothetical protein